MLRRLAALALLAGAWLAAPSVATAQLTVRYGNGALAAATFGVLTHPGSVSGANTGCKPSAKHPVPVILVHATFADEADNWVTLSPLLANAGYCVYAFNYGQTDVSLGNRIDGLGDIPSSARQLSSFVSRVLSQTGATKVDLVGHSQGGLMPNYYMKRLGGAPKVKTFVALAPSNHGTTLDGLLTLANTFPFLDELTTDLSDLLGAPALAQQEAHSTFETRLFADGDTVPGPRYTVIETDHDKVVTPYTNAFLHGSSVTNILIQHQCPSDPVGHVGIFDDSPVLQNVLNQLGSASPSFRAACTNYGQPY